MLLVILLGTYSIYQGETTMDKATRKSIKIAALVNKALNAGYEVKYGDTTDIQGYYIGDKAYGMARTKDGLFTEYVSIVPGFWKSL